jgi:Single-strand binding protein family
MSTFLFHRTLPISARAFSTSSRTSTFAKITLIGRLGDSPEVVPTSTGTEILRYNVATNSGPRDNPKTSWFRVTSFTPEGSQRDFIAGLEKGYVLHPFLTLVPS